MWKLQKFSLTFISQKFRESNGFTKEFAIYLNDLTKFFLGEREFLVFPHCVDDTVSNFTKCFYVKENLRFSKLFAAGLNFFSYFGFWWLHYNDYIPTLKIVAKETQCKNYVFFLSLLCRYILRKINLSDLKLRFLYNC